MQNYKYNPWPSGKLPKSWQRPELAIVMKKHGIKEPREVVDLFEKTISGFAGAPYAVAVDSCTNALFLCIQLYKHDPRKWAEWAGMPAATIGIPKRTYISVPQAIINAGFKIDFRDDKWTHYYKLFQTFIYDCAIHFTSDMYKRFINVLNYRRPLICLSFQIKKRLPIGKGGMILTNDKAAYEWLKKARYEGRDITKSYDKDQLGFIGWNMYMTPEDAARGLILFDKLTKGGKVLDFPPICDYSNYTDLSKQKEFKKWTV